jgi:hypothetical protein
VYALLDRPADVARERTLGEEGLRELRRDDDSGPLTKREREVVGLVAAGALMVPPNASRPSRRRLDV